MILQYPQKQHSAVPLPCDEIKPYIRYKYTVHAPYTRIGDNPTQNTPTEPLFRTCLKEIADLYVQTITYRLFAACARNRDTFTRKTAFDITPPTIGIIRDVFPFIRAAQPTRRMEVMIDDTASIVNAADWKLSSNNTSTKEREKTRSFTFTRPSSPSTLLRPYPFYTSSRNRGRGGGGGQCDLSHVDMPLLFW